MNSRRITTLAALLTFGFAMLTLSATASALGPKAFRGKPTFKAGQSLGMYVWKDATGLHARFTTKGLPRKFAGTVCTSGKILKASGALLEKTDSVTVGPKRRCLSFNFLTAGHIDGFDLRAPGALLTWKVRMNGAKLPRALIRVGKSKVRPLNNPFVLKR